MQGVSLSLRVLQAGPILIFVTMIIMAGLLSPNSLTPRNLSNILAQTAFIAMLSMGQFIVILTHGIDLSVGSCVALCSVIGAAIFRDGGAGATVVLTMLVTGAVVGAVNGLIGVYGRLPHPFLIALATLSIFKGLPSAPRSLRPVASLPPGP